jgi:hypothetical protein
MLTTSKTFLGQIPLEVSREGEEAHALTAIREEIRGPFRQITGFSRSEPSDTDRTARSLHVSRV